MQTTAKIQKEKNHSLIQLDQLNEAMVEEISEKLACCAMLRTLKNERYMYYQSENEIHPSVVVFY